MNTSIRTTLGRCGVGVVLFGFIAYGIVVMHLAAFVGPHTMSDVLGRQLRGAPWLIRMFFVDQWPGPIWFIVDHFVFLLVVGAGASLAHWGLWRQPQRGDTFAEKSKPPRLATPDPRPIEATNAQDVDCNLSKHERGHQRISDRTEFAFESGRAHFANLPEKVQERLRARQAGYSYDQLRIPRLSSVIQEHVCLVALAAMFILHVYLASRIAFDAANIAFMLIVAVILGILTGHIASSVVRFHQLCLKPCSYVTPLYVISTDKNRVSWQPLLHLSQSSIKDYVSSGGYHTISIELTFVRPDDGSFTVGTRKGQSKGMTDLSPASQANPAERAEKQKQFNKAVAKYILEQKKYATYRQFIKELIDATSLDRVYKYEPYIKVAWNTARALMPDLNLAAAEGLQDFLNLGSPCEQPDVPLGGVAGAAQRGITLDLWDASGRNASRSCVTHQTLPVPSRAVAEDVLVRLQSFRETAAKQAAVGNVAYFEDNDDFASVSGFDASESVPRWSNRMTRVMQAAFATAWSLSIVVAFAIPEPSQRATSTKLADADRMRYVDADATESPPRANSLANYDRTGGELPLQPQPTPSTGSVQAFTRAEHVAPLQIHARGTSNHLVKLVDTKSKATVMTVFVRAGTVVDTKVPLGTYWMRFAEGTTWYGYKDCFGKSTVYRQADEMFEFLLRGNTLTGCEVTLYEVPNGNLQSHKIDESEF